MAVVNMIKTIKEVLPDYVVLVKIGTFFESYNDDAKIISYLLNYKLRDLVDNNKSCGFPVNSINRVKFILESKSINYILIDKKHSYEEIEKMNYKKKNKYKNINIIANEYIDKINRIKEITKYLNNNSNMINKVEKLIYER